MFLRDNLKPQSRRYSKRSSHLQYNICKAYNPESVIHNSKRTKHMDDFDLILQNGIKFGRGGDKKRDDDGKVKTKAKKKKYITGAHGSGSAMQKAKYRQQRATRHKK